MRTPSVSFLVFRSGKIQANEIRFRLPAANAVRHQEGKRSAPTVLTRRAFSRRGVETPRG